jgi:cobalt-precorrin 5A hydrolase
VKLHIFTVTERGLRLARKIEKGFNGAVVYPPSQLRQGGLKKRVKEAFGKGQSCGLVFVTAVAVSVRSIAPFLRGKRTDPPVVTVDELGRFAVSLLSGHIGGANELARKVAGLIGAKPVITTATDLHGLPCVEDIAKRFSLEIDGVKKIKLINSAILNGAGVVVIDKEPARLRAIKEAFGPAGVFRFQRSVPKRLKEGAPLVVISAKADEKIPRSISDRTLFLRPGEFVVGLGCMRGVSVKEVERACGEVLSEHGLSPLAVRNFATIDIKKDESGLKGFLKRARKPVEFFTGEELGSIRPPSGPSRVVKENIGVGGVAEPSALLSAGAKRIWIKKQKKGRVTVAVARVPST